VSDTSDGEDVEELDDDLIDEVDELVYDLEFKLRSQQSTKREIKAADFALQEKLSMLSGALKHSIRSKTN